MVRRPLCLAALVYLFSVLLLLHFCPASGEDLSEWDHHTVCIEGIAADKEYKTSEDGSVQLVVTLESAVLSPAEASDAVSGDEDLQPATGGTEGRSAAEEKGQRLRHRILCRTGDGSPEDAEAADERIRIGDAVHGEGVLRTFRRASNSGEFDANLYYRTLGYSGQLTQAVLENRSGAQTSGGNVCRKMHWEIGERLHRIRRKLCGVLDRCLSVEDAGVMKAMLLGEKGSLDPEIKSLYQSNGIVHILAISGLHISLLGMGLYRILRRLAVYLPVRAGEVLSAGIAMLAMLLYGRMTGMGASSCRAIVMFCLRLLARLLHRTYDLLTALSVAGLLLAAQQPLYLRHSGFLFSFTAVLGIGLLMPAFSSKWMKAMAVHLAVLPVYLTFYCRFPIYSVVLNLIVIPLAGTAMAGGLLTVLAGSIWTPIGMAAGRIPAGILGLYTLLCRLCAALPLHQVNLGAPRPGQIVLYGILLALLAGSRDWLPFLAAEARLRIAEERKERYAEGVRILLAAAAVVILCVRGSGGLALHVIDVGQGDGLLLQAEGENVLVDAGSTDRTKVGRYQVIPLLQYYGVREVTCIVTHEDEDHISGVRELLSEPGTGIRIKALYLPSVREEEKTESYLALTELAAQGGVPVIELSEGMLLQKEELRLLCLHPEKESRYGEANERSVVLHLTYGAFTCLLNGDLEGEGEKRLLEYAGGEGMPLTLLHVAHHGSNGATSTEFLEHFRPLYAYVSCGEGNRYGHPGREAMERLRVAGVQEIYDTRETGEITFRARKGGRRLTVRTFRSR